MLSTKISVACASRLGSESHVASPTGPFAVGVAGVGAWAVGGVVFGVGFEVFPVSLDEQPATLKSANTNEVITKLLIPNSICKLACNPASQKQDGDQFPTRPFMRRDPGTSSYKVKPNCTGFVDTSPRARYRLKVLKSRFLKSLSLLTVVFGLAVVASIAFLMSADNAKVTLLYTTKEPIPNIAFELGSVPLSIASLIKYGSRSFELLPATSPNLEKALAKSEFLVIGTHGSDGFIFSDEKRGYGPPQTPNPNTKFIYFGSCYFGAKRAELQRSFPNAKLIGQDGLAYQSASALYLFFVAPVDLLRL